MTPDASHSRDFWLALGFTTLLFLLVHGYALLGQPWVVNDDTRQQLFWMQQWQHPELYQGDCLAEYARRYVTWGVQAVYRLAAHVVSPLTFSKWLAGLEYIATGGLLFVLGRGLGSGGAARAAGWSVLCLYWLSPFFLHTISGGLARSFGLPLMALFWLSWQQGGAGASATRRHFGRLGILASLLLLGLFLPYIWALCGLALALGWLLGLTKRFPAPPAPRKWWDYLVLAVSALPVLLYNQELAGSGFGPMVNEAQMQGNPVFGPLGRFPIMPVPSLFFELVARPLERLLPFRELGPLAGALVAAGLGVLIWQGARRSGWRELARSLRPFLFLLAASVLFFFLARALLLALFIPSRYLEYTTNLAYVVLPGVLIGGFLGKTLRRQALGIALVLACLALAGWRLHGEALYDYSQDAPLYEAVRQTPPSALFAGHPYTMDNVLTFGRRSVLASYELAHPWSVGLWQRLRPRLEDMLAAYYARDAQTVRSICQIWNIDYMVVKEEHFSPRFMLPGRQLVPVCQAPMPDLAHTACKTLGLRFPVMVRLGEGAPYPGDHPLFAPYGQRIARLARAKDFALLDRELFPGQEVSPGVWLLEMQAKSEETPAQEEARRTQ